MIHRQQTPALVVLGTVLVCAMVAGFPLHADTESPDTNDGMPSRNTLLDSLRRIHQIGDPVNRALAYDELAVSLFGKVERQTASPESDGKGGWTAWVETDPITDEAVFFASLEAKSGRNEFGTPPTLAIRRTGEQDELFVVWSDYFAEDEATVTYRIDKQDARTLSWHVSTTDEATFYPADATALIRRLLQAEQLAIRGQPYNASPITAVFDLQGLQAVVEDHAEHVGDWLPN